VSRSESGLVPRPTFQGLTRIRDAVAALPVDTAMIDGEAIVRMWW
jgi:hypothetical protein